MATCFDLIPAAYAPEYLGGAGRAGQRAAFARFLARLRAAPLVLVPSGETAGDVVRLAGVDAGRVADGAARGATGAGRARGRRARRPVRALRRRGRAAQERRAGPRGDRRGRARRAPGDGRPVVGAPGRPAARPRRPGGRRRPRGLAGVRAGGPARGAAGRRGGRAGALAQGGLRVPRAGGDGRRRARARQRDTPALREVGGDAAAAYLPAADAGAWAREISRLADAPDDERARAGRGGAAAGGAPSRGPARRRASWRPTGRWPGDPGGGRLPHGRPVGRRRRGQRALRAGRSSRRWRRPRTAGTRWRRSSRRRRARGRWSAFGPTRGVPSADVRAPGAGGAAGARRPRRRRGGVHLRLARLDPVPDPAGGARRVVHDAPRSGSGRGRGPCCAGWCRGRRGRRRGCSRCPRRRPATWRRRCGSTRERCGW